MVIKILDDRTVRKEYQDNEGTQNESRITTLNLDIPEDYSDFVKKIVFITEDGNFFDYIQDDTYILKNNITKYKEVKAYIWLTNSITNQDFRSEMFDLDFNYNENPSDYVPSEEEKTQFDLMVEELEELIQEVQALPVLKREIVEELPTEDIDPNTIYMILRTDPGESDIYDEWMYIDDNWELIGNTEIDLTDYYTKDETDEIVGEVSEQIETIESDLYGTVEYNVTTGEKVINGTVEDRDLSITKVKGESEQESTKGYQLLNKTQVAGNNAQVTIIQLDTGFRVETASGGYAGTITIDIKPNTDYYLNFVMTVISGTFKSVKVFAGTTQTTQIENFIESGGTFNTGNNTKINIWFYGSAGTGGTVEFTNVQLEEGTTAHNWEQYTGGIPAPNPDFPFPVVNVTGNNSVEVNNKNLYNKDTDYVGGVYSDTGVWNGNVPAWTTSDWIEVSSILYTLSSQTTSSRNSFFSEFDKNKNFIQRTSSTSFTPTANTKYVRLSFKNDIGMYDIQLEIGNQATSYQPYSHQTKPLNLGSLELCKIGTYQDYIYRANGKFYKHSDIKKTENVENLFGGFATGGDGRKYVLVSKSNLSMPTGTYSDLRIYCNKFNFQTVVANRLPGQFLTNSNNANVQFIVDDTYTSIDQVKDNIKNVTAYCALETPTETEITDTTLINQLNEIYELKQYQDTTIITINDINNFDILLDGSRIDKMEDDIGNTSQLTTTVKTDLVAAINEVNGAIGDIDTALDTIQGEVV